MSNIAFGHSICYSSPHYKSTLLGINEYLMEGDKSFSLYSGALKIGISLFFNLPHLCGIGGDAMIIKKIKGIYLLSMEQGKQASIKVGNTMKIKDYIQFHDEGFIVLWFMVLLMLLIL
ncbi:hypothetical protein XNW1_2970009 [Xenorhabdus nematophila str. Websteri]|nr:hypothetical protein XNW1_2970009 [Xenorhabdus nematophila str. Websteri]